MALCTACLARRNAARSHAFAHIAPRHAETGKAFSPRSPARYTAQTPFGYQADRSSTKAFANFDAATD
jgi:hypothetical protein